MSAVIAHLGRDPLALEQVVAVDDAGAELAQRVEVRSSQPTVRGRWSSPMNPIANGASSSSASLVGRAVERLDHRGARPVAVADRSAGLVLERRPRPCTASGRVRRRRRTAARVSAVHVAQNASASGCTDSGRSRDGTMTMRSATTATPGFGARPRLLNLDPSGASAVK
jgi:hypothetical protein